MDNTRKYAAIDLKSFYASVECILRKLDPLNTNLVVADESRTEKTICLAVSPALRSYNISGRLRLFELIQKVKTINLERLKIAKYFSAKSYNHLELINNPNLELDYIVAKPRMSAYIDYSSKIYSIYLKYFDPKDIHIYSIDEVFIDLTPYIRHYKISADKLIENILFEILKTTQITATAGIGTNLYLAKIAMDILAKKQNISKDGLCIGYLDEMLYRRKLWQHTPINDFWRIGKGYATKLKSIGINNMGDLARYSLNNEDKLYQIFGVNAELLIDHAWGFESCTMQAIKEYKSKHISKVMAKVLPEPYSFKKARDILKEIVDHMVLELIEQNLTCNQIVLDIQYDKESLEKVQSYKGPMSKDSYGRSIPKNAHSTINLDYHTSSLEAICNKGLELFDLIVNADFLIRKISLTLNNVVKNDTIKNFKEPNLFADIEQKENKNLIKEEKLQKARLAIVHKYGKKSIFKASSLENGLKINSQIGGHNA
ncbi:TPA: DNA methylase [Campylobacter coli]|nr:DNA methylase [Campylobacter coli]HEB9324096.1 DNA methylase [Campylobacter coli]HEB9336936.1 DNA methylase [Campylobacter coli]